MVKEIICSGGEIVMVDDEDHPLLSRHKWHYTANGDGSQHYVVTRLNTSLAKNVRTIFMHTLIIGFCFTVDHKDHNTLNCMKENLRPATWQENGWNARKMSKASGGRQCSSQYKGISRFESKKLGTRWRVIIKLSKKGEAPARFARLGHYATELEAAQVYNREIVKLRGEFAYVNPL